MKLAPTREHPAPVAPGEVVLAPPQRHRGLSRRLVLVTVVLAVVAGGVGGYVAYLVSEDGLTRGRATDAARWQAMADAHASAERAGAAEAARWEAMGDAHLRDQVALARGRAAEAARWEAMGDAHLRDQVALARGRAAEAARWQALADAIREGTLAGP